LLVVETSLGHSAFGTASLPFRTWLVPLPVALAMLAVSELVKAVRRAKARLVTAAVSAARERHVPCSPERNVLQGSNR